jgi:hypothetical protein
MDAMENSRDNSSNILRARGKGKGRGSRGPSHQHNTNWNDEEVMALNSCKDKEHIILKQVVYPRANMILAM